MRLGHYLHFLGLFLLWCIVKIYLLLGIPIEPLILIMLLVPGLVIMPEALGANGVFSDKLLGRIIEQLVLMI
jgi:hypothetical protein